MNELIKITEKDGFRAISARMLYKFLTEESDLKMKNFNQWANRNIVNNVVATIGIDD